MVRNRNVAKAMMNCGWEMFTNFLAHKLERKGGKLGNTKDGAKVSSTAFPREYRSLH
ncbi:MAG TPA: hypothetical protein V6D25_27485 [Leptolyngbyaceae cyanobacterium]